MTLPSSHGLGRPWTDLWLFDFEMQHGPPLDAGPGAQLLDAWELERASRFASPAQAQAFLASHAGLRHVLMEYGCDGGATFLLGANGKPFLPGGPYFNLSRTRQAAIVAVSNVDVGIDIERRRTVTLTEPKIEEVGALLRRTSGLGGAMQDSIQIWTAIEAWVKYRGHSIQDFLANKAAVTLMAEDLAASRVALRPLNLPPEMCGTVCTGAESTLNYVESDSLLGLQRWSPRAAITQYDQAMPDHIGSQQSRPSSP